jgi:hypothetical protein
MPTATPNEIVNGVKDQPLGLPRGSVRAIMALEIVTAFIALVSHAAITGATVLSPAVLVLGTIVATVCGWYFAKRDSEGQEASAKVREWLVGELTQMKLEDDENGET